MPFDGSMRRVGRPSRHPETVRYCEAPTVLERMRSIAEREALSFSEVQRRINRAGLEALGTDA